jgi:hypothetical protein
MFSIIIQDMLLSYVANRRQRHIEIIKMKFAGNEGVCSSLWGAAAAYAR